MRFPLITATPSFSLCPCSAPLAVPLLIDYWWRGEANSWAEAEKRSITEKLSYTRRGLKIGGCILGPDQSCERGKMKGWMSRMKRGMRDGIKHGESVKTFRTLTAFISGLSFILTRAEPIKDRDDWQREWQQSCNVEVKACVTACWSACYNI